MSESTTETPNKYSAWLRLIEDYPGAWVIIGLSIVLIAMGCLNFSSAYVILHQPSEPAMRSSLIILGLSSLLLGCYMILVARGRSNRCLNLILTLVEISIIGVVIYASVVPANNQRGPVVSWGYDITHHKFTVGLSPLRFIPYQGEMAVLVCHKDSDTVDEDTDPHIVIGTPFPVPSPHESEFDKAVDCKAIEKDIRIGDMVYCYLFVYPKDANINKVKTLNELRAAGAQVVGGGGNEAMIDGTNVDDLMFAYHALPARDRVELRREIAQK